MQFSPDNIAKIVAGTKTQTRRAFKEGDDWLFLALGVTPPDHASETRITLDELQPVAFAFSRVKRGGRTLYAVHSRRALQPGRGQAAVGRIEITDVRLVAHASTISDDDARAEGYETPDAFRAAYGRLNGAAALDRPCWRITFTLVKGATDE